MKNTWMEKRHSIRSYNDMKIPDETRDELDELIENINNEYGTHIQAFYDESDCFSGFMAKYGKFSGVRNYISLTAKKEEGYHEKLGYLGEMIVEFLMKNDLGSCFVGLTHGKSKAKIKKNEKEACILCFGYQAKEGVSHKVKDIDKVSDYKAGDPEWYLEGIKAALLAPTAMNQQKFYFSKTNEEIHLKKGFGPYTAFDLGIVKYNFEKESEKKVIIG